MSNLRPIGTEFEVSISPTGCNSIKPQKIRYRIVAHVPCEGFKGETILLEEIRSIAFDE